MYKGEEPMRILHVTTFFQGGAGRIIAALAGAQRRAGHDVIVAGDASAERGYESYPEYLDQLAQAGIPFHALTSTFKRDVALNVQAAVQLRQTIASQSIDIAHAHAAIPSLVARLALAGPRYVPVVQTMHGWGVRKTPEQAETDIALLGMSDRVVTPSEAARKTLTGLGLRGVRIHVIPYGIEPDPPAAEVDVEDRLLLTGLRDAGRRVAMCIGTIGERKNQSLLLRASAHLSDVDVVLIGDGDASRLHQLADELGIAQRVHVLGYRTNASRYLAFADVMVLPSRNEGLPIAVLEAFRAGIPVVGSAIPEIAEAIEEGRTGFLFEPENPRALAASLDRAVRETDRDARQRRLRAEFDARYVSERMIAAYERLYLELRP
jgi:L-malate glycosyltransferase